MADITIEIQSSPAVFETVVPSAVDVSMYVAGPAGPAGATGPPGPAGATGPPGPAGATVLTYTAGVDLSGHRMVVLDADAKAIYADNTVAAHANKVIGMTTGAAMTDTDATIQSGGELTEPSWAWTLDVPVWLGETGLLTQTVPESGFSLIVGFPITATKIFIDIREPIFLI